MLDRRFVRENLDAVRAATARRHIEIDFDKIAELDRDLLRLQQEREETKAEQRRLAKAMPQLPNDEKPAAGARAKELKQAIKPLEEEIAKKEAEFAPLFLEIPNLADPDVPDGTEAEDNKEVRRWGEPPKFDFEIRDHLDLGTELGLIDVKRAVQLAGARTYLLRGDLMLLELAVLRFALDKIRERGFLPMSPPVLVRESAMEGTGYLPVGADQAYQCTRDDGWLIGTSEVPITALHAGERLAGEDLPIRYAGYSNCFRREAGTSGKDTRGIYRVHQFAKVEQVVIARSDVEESKSLHEEILQNALDVLQDLKLPYRVVALCGGDLGRSATFTYDVETWMPGRNAYGETHSASRYYDYQARRLNLRYRDADQKPVLCHTLNNTVIASPRILVALMENYQRADGSIAVPECLVPILGKEVLDPAPSATVR
ncbi:MAG: serine--tRNA ligase [Planctomycetota bacterium]